MAGYILGVYPAAVVNVAPQISDKTFNINDGYADGQTVGTVTLDNTPSPAAEFSITAGNDAGAFEIDADTGEITIATGATLDHDTTASYSLTVQASNTAGSNTATITVNVAAAGADTLIDSFTVEEFADAASPASRLYGMAFPKGMVPSGSIPVIQTDSADVPATFGQRTTWSDGSLKFAVCALRDSDFTASETRTYSRYARSGSFDDTNTATLADVLALVDPQVAFSSLTETDDSSTSTHGTGAALAKLSDHAAVSTRVTVPMSGPTFKRWYVWGMAKDGSTGSGDEDAHLKVEWEVDAWFDGSGDIEKVTVVPVICLDWFTTTGKTRLNYTATFKNGSTTIETYSSIQHSYRQRWAMVRIDDDNNSGRPHVLLGSIDTLNYKPDQDTLIASYLMPPIDVSISADEAVGYGEGSLDTYVPLTIQGHKTGVDNPGALPGRGMVTHFDAHAFGRQGARDMRIARVNAQVGLACPCHFRSSATRTRSGETADTANTILALRMDNASGTGATDTWEVDGMPTAGTASEKSGGTLTYSAPTGTNTSIMFSGESSHQPNYSWFAYLMEGNYYLLQSIMDHATAVMITRHANGFAQEAPQFGYPVETNSSYRKTQLSIPSTQWSSLTVNYQESERGTGFALMLIGCAAAICPDDAVEKNFLVDLNAHQGDYFSTSLTYMHSTQLATGIWRAGNKDTDPGNRADYICSPWMLNFMGQGAAWNNLITEDSGIGDFADFCAKFVVGLLGSHKYRSKAYRGGILLKSDRWDITDNPYRAQDALLVANPMAINGTTDVCTFTINFGINNGDKVYPVRIADGTEGSPDTSFASPLVEGTAYYMINVSGNTCKLSATEGGSAINFSADDTQNVVIELVTDNTTASPADSEGHDYAAIANQHLVLQNLRGATGATDALCDEQEAFIANQNYADSLQYKFKRIA